MSDQLELHDIQALAVLQSSLNRFQSDIEDALAQANAKIVRAQQWVAGVTQQRRHDLEAARRQVAECEYALHRCENSGCYDQFGRYWPPDCTGEQIALHRARQDEQACQDRLMKAYTWQSRIDAAASEFAGQSNQMEQVAGSETTRACAELAGLAQRYTEVHAGAASLAGALARPGAEGKHAYPYQKARKEFMLDSLSDPGIAKHIRGWMQQEYNRYGKSGYWHSPPGYDVGHKVPGIDQASNFRWEEAGMNRSRGGKFKR